MAKNSVRAEITVNGLVQGVGFRYYILRQAQNLELKGCVKNLFTGEVYTLAEGERGMIEELIKLIILCRYSGSKNEKRDKITL